MPTLLNNKRNFKKKNKIGFIFKKSLISRMFTFNSSRFSSSQFSSSRFSRNLEMWHIRGEELHELMAADVFKFCFINFLFWVLYFVDTYLWNSIYVNTWKEHFPNYEFLCSQAWGFTFLFVAIITIFYMVRTLLNFEEYNSLFYLAKDDCIRTMTDLNAVMERIKSELAFYGYIRKKSYILYKRLHENFLLDRTILHIFLYPRIRAGRTSKLLFILWFGIFLLWRIDKFIPTSSADDVLFMPDFYYFFIVTIAFCQVMLTGFYVTIKFFTDTSNFIGDYNKFFDMHAEFVIIVDNSPQEPF